MRLRIEHCSHIALESSLCIEPLTVQRRCSVHDKSKLKITFKTTKYFLAEEAYCEVGRSRHPLLECLNCHILICLDVSMRSRVSACDEAHGDTRVQFPEESSVIHCWGMLLHTAGQDTLQSSLHRQYRADRLRKRVAVPRHPPQVDGRCKALFESFGHDLCNQMTALYKRLTMVSMP